MRRGLAILQSGGPTAVINATLAGAIAAARQHGCTTIVGVRNGFAGLLDGSFLAFHDLTESDLAQLALRPGAVLGTSRYRLDENTAQQAIEQLRTQRIEALVAIGGNDTAQSALTLLSAAAADALPLAVVVAPKTVDNDLAETDFAPGFPSAARFVADSVRDLLIECDSVRNLYAFTLLELPGRNAGWLVASAAFAVEPDLRPHVVILFPERPPASRDDLVGRLIDHTDHYGWSLIVVPETLRDASGLSLAGAPPRWVDPYGHPYPESPGESIARALEQLSGRRARVIRPGALVRCFTACTTAVDRTWAWAVGSAAAEWAIQGKSGVMAAIERVSDWPYHARLRPVPLSAVAGRERLLPADFVDPSGDQPSSAFYRYLAPLVASPIEPGPPLAEERGPRP